MSWSAVTGATGYRVWRKSNSTIPSGTGNYLVGSTAATTLNDQSNTLQSATVPSLNTTDPKTLSQVRVTAAPSPGVILAASQITGTAIVANPTATQVITAPAAAGVVPLRVRGNSTANANVLEVYDSAGTPALASRFDVNGALNTAKQITSTLASGTAPFSVASNTEVANLRSATATALAANGANCPRSNASTPSQNLLTSPRSGSPLPEPSNLDCTSHNVAVAAEK